MLQSLRKSRAGIIGSLARLHIGSKGTKLYVWLQVGCVLGKQGSIVSRVRDSTGAMVRVLEQNKGQRRLETGEEVDEVIEIQGRAESCDSALQAVSDLLRQYQVSDFT